MRSRPFIVVALLAALIGCATAPPDSAPESATGAAGSATLPTPYAAEQIRDANPPGTRLVFRVEQAGQEPMLQIIVFRSGDAEVGIVEQHSTTLDGRPVGEPEAAESPWTELRDHAAFPADRATRDRSRCTVAAGRFDCWRYTVTEIPPGEGAPTTSVFHFATDRPGPPVLYEMHRDGERVFRMELLEDTRS